MGRIKNSLAALALVGAVTFSFSGCDNRPTETQQKTTVCQTTESGTNLRIMPITSDRHYWEQKQKEVRAKVEEVVNGGEYNTVSVKTSYSDAYLTSAEIAYSAADDCANRNIRVIFLHSDRYYWEQKQKEVKPKLENLVNSGKYDIQNVNTVMLQGYLVAAEIYYRKNPNQQAVEEKAKKP